MRLGRANLAGQGMRSRLPGAAGREDGTAARIPAAPQRRDEIDRAREADDGVLEILRAVAKIGDRSGGIVIGALCLGSQATRSGHGQSVSLGASDSSENSEVHAQKRKGPAQGRANSRSG